MAGAGVVRSWLQVWQVLAGAEASVSVGKREWAYLHSWATRVVGVVSTHLVVH